MTTSLFIPTPIAAINPHDFLEIAFIAIAIFGWILAQIGSAVKKAQFANQQRMNREKLEVPPEVLQPANPEVTDEIEKFLREAAERRSGRPAPASARVSTPPQPRPSTSKPAKRDAKGGQRRQSLAQQGDAQRKEAADKEPQRQTVDAYVDSRLDNRQFADRAAHLTKVDSEKKIDEHLHAQFDHRLGQLAGTTLESREGAAPALASTTSVTANETATEPGGATTRGTGLMALLTDPSNLKNAMILNEIMTRPDERWEL